MAVPPAIIHFDQIFPFTKTLLCVFGVPPFSELESPRCSPQFHTWKMILLGLPVTGAAPFSTRGTPVTGAMFHTQHLLRDSKLETTSISPAGADPLDSILEYTCVYTCIYIYITCIYIYITCIYIYISIYIYYMYIYIYITCVYIYISQYVYTHVYIYI